MIFEALSKFHFEVYNTNDSWYPLFVPTFIWLSSYLYCKYRKLDYAHWYALHTFHHFGVISQALLSLYYNDDAIFNERIPILWSLPYFGIDIVECIITKHYTYLFHGALSFALGLANYNIPLHRTLRITSRADLVEISTPIFYMAKLKRSPVWFGIFAIVFTACRIIWIPMIAKILFENIPSDINTFLFGFICLAVAGFYGLNIFWYSKIINLLWNGNKSLTPEKKMLQSSSSSSSLTSTSSSSSSSLCSESPIPPEVVTTAADETTKKQD